MNPGNDGHTPDEKIKNLAWKVAEQIHYAVPGGITFIGREGIREALVAFAKAILALNGEAAPAEPTNPNPKYWTRIRVKEPGDDFLPPQWRKDILLHHDEPNPPTQGMGKALQ